MMYLYIDWSYSMSLVSDFSGVFGFSSDNQNKRDKRKTGYRDERKTGYSFEFKFYMDDSSEWRRSRQCPPTMDCKEYNQVCYFEVQCRHVRPKRENNHDFIPYIMIEKITHFFVVFFIGHVLLKLSESLLGFLFGADFLR